jgi:hypothetical protein
VSFSPECTKIEREWAELNRGMAEIVFEIEVEKPLTNSLIHMFPDM